MRKLPAIQPNQPIISPSTPSLEKSFVLRSSNSSASHSPKRDNFVMMRAAQVIHISGTMDKDKDKGLSRGMKIFKVFLAIVAAMIIFLQILTILGQYTSYPVTSSTREHSLSYEQVKKVSLCAEAAELVAPEKLPADISPKWTELKDKFKGRDDFVYEASAELAALTISSIDAMTPAYEEVVEKAEMRDAMDSTMKPMGNVTTYYRGLMKCFLFDTMDQNYQKLAVSTYGQMSGIILAIQLKADIASKVKFTLFVHKDKAAYGMNPANVMALDLAKTRWVKVSYRFSVIYSLMSPYSTNCNSYSAEGFESAAHMQDSCFRDHFEKKYSSVPGFVYQTQTGTLPVMSAKKVDSDEKIRSDLIEQAKTSCGGLMTDCTEELIYPTELVRETTEEVGVAPMLYVMYPTEPHTITTYVPQMTFAGVCGDIGGILLVWLIIILLARRVLRKCSGGRTA